MSLTSGGLPTPEPSVNFICHKCNKPAEMVLEGRDAVLLRPEFKVLCHGESILVKKNLAAIHHYGHMPVFLEVPRD